MRHRVSEGWSSLFLLTGMCLSVAWAISYAKWVNEGLEILPWVSLGAVLAGVLLAKSGFPGLMAHFFSLVYGTAWLSYQCGRLLTLENDITDLAPLWRERLLELGYRIGVWIYRILYEGSSHDDLIFVIFLAIIIWLVSYVGAWLTFRSRRVWWAITPNALVLVVNLHYGPPDLGVYLVVFLICALLLVVRVNLYRQQWRWQEGRVRYDPDITFDFLRDGIITTVVLIALAWAVPNAVTSTQVARLLAHLEKPWSTVQENWNRLFPSLRSYRYIYTSVYGRTMTLGGPVTLEETAIMDVRAPAGRYWRAIVYDEYTGSMWRNTDTEEVLIGPDSPPLAFPRYELRQEITVTFTCLLPNRMQLFAASEPISVSIPAKALLSYVRQDEGKEGLGAHISSLYSRSLLKQGASYYVISSISIADEESLRQAGDEYPEWVRQRYLQLPDSLPQEVRDLAEEITQDYDNAYDKAVAIERYLRGFTYNDAIEAPPAGRDAVAYFLFDVKEGYCNYYASAMAVMARAVGIPARIASGYSRGEYDASLGVYRVRDRNSHSWVEVYFPRYGWVEFEPTATEEPIVRPVRRTATEEELKRQRRSQDRPPLPRPEDLLLEEKGLEDIELPPLPRQSRQVSPLVWALGGGMALIMVGVAFLRLWYERKFRGLRPVELAYARMCQMAEWVGLPPRPQQTPYEYAAVLIEAVPAGREQVRRIVDEYVKARFGRREDQDSEVLEAWRALRSLLGKYWLSRWKEKLARSRLLAGRRSRDWSVGSW